MITVLVVEDETYARQSLIKQIVEYDMQKQFHIVEASNGEVGYDLFCKTEPELIMTDIRMPKMDGLELISAIREKNKNAAIVMVSAYSDFEYARTALTFGAADYLLKPIDKESLKNCLDKFQNFHRTRKRETMITGQDAVTKFIGNCILNQITTDFIGSSMFGKIFPVYQVLAFYVYNTVSLNQESILSNLEKKTAREMWTGFRLIQVRKRLFALIVRDERGEGFLPGKLLTALTEEGYDCCIGVSREYTMPEELLEAFREAVITLEYKIMSANKILSYNQPKVWDKAKYYLEKPKEKLLQEALEEKNTRKIEYVIREIFKEVRSVGKIEQECLELLFSHILIILKGFIQESSKGEERLRESSVGVMDFRSLTEMEQYLMQIGINICELGRKNKLSERENSTTDLVNVMKEYAKEHYSQDITVKELAEQVLFMNPAYVSHIFAEKTGSSFSSWLRNLRIRHAKKFLQDGNLSVTDAVSMSGYNDTSQFIRAFKQETGITPKKYKDQMKTGIVYCAQCADGNKHE